MIALFPVRFQTALVRSVVNELKALPSQKQRNEQMIRIVGQKFEWMASTTDDAAAIEQDLIDFADVVWHRVTGERRGGAA
jgi:hypothetical protein